MVDALSPDEQALDLKVTTADFTLAGTYTITVAATAYDSSGVQ